MNVPNIPDEVLAIPRPEWATADYGWERDGGSDGYARTVFRMCGDVVTIIQGQAWEPGRGLIEYEPAIIGLDEIQSIHTDAHESAPDTARATATELLEAARVWEEMGLS